MFGGFFMMLGGATVGAYLTYWLIADRHGHIQGVSFHANGRIIVAVALLAACAWAFVFIGAHILREEMKDRGQ